MISFIKYARGFFFMFALYVRQSFYHKSAAIAVIVTWVLRLGLTMILYGSIYKLIGRESIRNITFDVAVSGMLFFTLFSIFSIRELNRTITREYKAGSLEIWYTKPLPYMLLKLSEVVGKSVPALLGVSGMIVGYWAIAHHDFIIDHAILRLVLGFVLLMGGLLISIFIYGLVGLSAIFLTESKPVWFVVDKLIMIFGGIYIPIGFFPVWFRTAGETLPTGAATLGAQILYPDFLANAPRFLLLQCVWILLLGLALLKVNRLAEKHLTVNGG